MVSYEKCYVKSIYFMVYYLSNFLLRIHSMEKPEILSHQKIFREINYLVTL